MSTGEDVKRAIKSKLAEVYVKALRLTVPPATLADSGLVDSLGIDSINSLEILLSVEGEFAITVDDEDLTPALVDSLDRLADYVLQRKAAAQ